MHVLSHKSHELCMQFTVQADKNACTNFKFMRLLPSTSVCSCSLHAGWMMSSAVACMYSCSRCYVVIVHIIVNKLPHLRKCMHRIASNKRTRRNFMYIYVQYTFVVENVWMPVSATSSQLLQRQYSRRSKCFQFFIGKFRVLFVLWI